MAAINDPNIAANIGRVGMGSGMVWTPQHVSAGPIPVGNGGAYRLSMTSGTIAASLGANSELFQFRYTTSNSRVALIHGISVSAAMIATPAASTTPVNISLRATLARAWTADGTGGTAATMTGNNQKLRTSHATAEAGLRMATTAALGAGTKTLDAQDIGSVVAGIYFDLAAGDVANILIPYSNLMGEFAGSLGFPIVLAHQEGFVIRSGAALPATMTWNMTCSVLWSEVDAF